MSVRVTLCAACLVLTAGGLRADPPPAAPVRAVGDTIDRVRVAAAKVEIARLKLELATERSAWAERMVAKKYMSPAQAKAEQLRLAEAQLAYAEALYELRSLGGKK